MRGIALCCSTERILDIIDTMPLDLDVLLLISTRLFTPSPPYYIHGYSTAHRNTTDTDISGYIDYIEEDDPEVVLTAAFNGGTV